MKERRATNEFFWFAALAYFSAVQGGRTLFRRPQAAFCFVGKRIFWNDGSTSAAEKFFDDVGVKVVKIGVLSLIVVSRRDRRRF